jgi:hypothetical protein
MRFLNITIYHGQIKRWSIFFGFGKSHHPIPLIAPEMLDPGPESWISFWVAMAMVAEDVVTIGGLTFPLRQMAAPWRWEFQWDNPIPIMWLKQ